MLFLVLLLIAVAVGVILYLAISKFQQRQLEAQKKEAEFLAAMRSGKGVAAPSATPLTLAMDSAIAAAKAAQANPAQALRGPGEASALMTAPVAAAPAPASGLACMFCWQPVDMMANDASKWGAKLPDAQTGRFVWVHFDCLNRRLTEASRYQASLEQLVATGTAIGAAMDPRLMAALERAKAVLPQAPIARAAPPA